MAVTANAVQTMLKPLGKGGDRWAVNASSANASGCEEIAAAPGAGYALVIERLILYIGAAISVTIGEDEGGDSAVAAVLIGPLGGAAGTYVLDCRERPIQMTANKALVFDASDAGTVCIYAEGFTRAS